MAVEPIKPRVLLVAGPNGSGKTTITERGLAHEWFQAANLAQTRRENCLESGASLAFESVFSGQDKVDFLERAKRRGFFIRVFFVATDSPTINAARVARRVMQGGHDVPIGKIVSRYFRSIANCASVAPLVDRLYLYDNSVEDAEARLVLRASDGKIIRMYQEPSQWTHPIMAELRQ